MGILDRISTMARANINAMLDKAEDPAKMLEQIIRDMANAIEEAKGQVAGVIAQEKLLEAEKAGAEKSAKEWGHRAEKAVGAGRDDLAREALRRKKDFESIATTYQQQYDNQHQMTSQLRGQLEILMRKYDDAVRNVSKVMGSLNGMDHSSELARMDHRLKQEEAKAYAMAELNSGANASIEDQFAQLDAGDGMDDELKAITSKLGKGGNQY